ncbi:MAG: aldo/keto reductase, partial [Fibrobacterota bacterium]
GKSEIWMANAIRKRRDEVYLSTKSNWRKGPSEDDVRKAIDKSLSKTGLDYFDFYQVWNLETMEILNDVTKKGGTWDGIKKAMDEGLIRHGLGFTFHGTPDVFKAAVDTGIFVSATVSYNLMDRREEELIKYAGERDTGIIIMNPLAGGQLGFARNKALSFLAKDGGSSPVYGSIRFLAANKNISSAIMGVSVPGHVDEDVKALEGADELTEEYRNSLIEAADGLNLSKEGLCTGCRYCDESCPEGLKPSVLMQALRDFKIYEMSDENLSGRLINKGVGQDQVSPCTACGNCDENCPQRLNVSKEMDSAKRIV